MSKQPPQHALHHLEPTEKTAEQGDSTLQLHHIPVLLDEVVRLLAPRPGESYLDLTAGYGGHAGAILACTDAPDAMTLVDRDSNAIRELTPFKDKGATLVYSDFARFTEQAVAAGTRYDMILVDLGVSSPQLDKAERGFSLRREGPLDMRMDQTMEKTAADIVNKESASRLIAILEKYGEETPSDARRIVTAIVDARPIFTTTRLAEVVLSTHRGAFKKTHPATRTFQAIRIALNGELDQVEQTLERIPNLLEPGGRVAIISFHSLEDRLVKDFFREQAEAGYEAELLPLTKKAILGKTYDVHNPRARSALLRAAVKK